MKRIVLLILLLNVGSVNAQENKCLSDFDYLVKKIKRDYPGYNNKITAEKEIELSTLEQKIRIKIATSPDSCRYFLREYTDYFKDNHLRIQSSSNQRNEWKTIDVSSYGNNIRVSHDSLKASTIGSSGIEGIWKGFANEFAVIKKEEGHYLGVAIKVNGWKQGQVMYELFPDGTNEYRLVEHAIFEGLKPRKNRATLQFNGEILEIHDNTWYARESESNAFDYATVTSYIPKFPNGRNTYTVALAISDSTFYLRLPSFHSDEAAKLVKKHWKEITTRPNLIIDIRNNGGGQDIYYQSLLKLIFTKPYLSKGVEWYASEGNIKIFEDDLKNGKIKDGEDGIKWTNALLAEMKKSKGKFVIHPMMGHDGTITEDTVYSYPKQVGIIINEGNASSAEQFLLSARNSSKVTLFGNSNTAGVLDYSNAVQVPFPSGNYNLIYPMTRSRRLPDNPIDNIGIAPDVIIPLPETDQLYSRLDGWVYFVTNYLEFKEN